MTAAEANHTESEALYRELGSAGGLAHSVTHLATTLQELGKLRRALAENTRARELARVAGNHFLEIYCLATRATILNDLGRSDEAYEAARLALAATPEVGDRTAESTAFNQLGAVELRLGRHARALGAFQRALHLSRDNGSPFNEIEALTGVARVLDVPEQALETAHEALALAREKSMRLQEGEAGRVLAETCLAADRVDEAVEHAERALAVFQETGQRLGEARACLTLGRALQRLGHTDRACDHWTRALALFTEIGTRDADDVKRLLESAHTATRETS